jgi:hypothetical protein
MPYRQIEEIRDRKGEKILLFFTLENIAGVGLGGAGGLIGGNVLTGSMIGGALLGVLLGVLGLLLTFDSGGLPGYERLQWLLTGLLRRATRGASISPEHLAGARATTRRDRPLRVGGPVQVVRRDALPSTGYRVSGSGYRGTSDSDPIPDRPDTRSGSPPPTATKEEHHGHSAPEQPAH